MPAKAVAREKEIQLAKIKDEDEKPASVGANLAKRASFSGISAGTSPGGDAGIGLASEFKRSPRFSRSLRRGEERCYRRIWRRKSDRSKRFI
jgi:hypothetical protein